ncbi:sulfotransferase domain-containing protein [Photobacterium makurazakiensis]|uniref:sulfotransferase family protein n=1 Tax=Photobacterium makurazakiensis TaxID=2910234 RepID=UPI003D116671
MDNSGPIFIIGSQKSGTTSLAKQLDNHHDICLSSPKEPEYFTRHLNKGDKWYKRCFSEQDKILVDASTSYSMCPLSKESLRYLDNREQLLNTPQKIRQAHKNAKIIYIVREPAMRTYSHYWHNVKYGREKRCFQQAIEEDIFYLEISRYYAQIDKYLQHFDKQNILVLKFEDYIINQLAVLNHCEDFIGISRTIELPKTHANKGQVYSNFGSFLISNPITKNIDRLLPLALKKQIKKRLANEIPKLDANERARINALFKEDLQQLKSHFGISYLPAQAKTHETA